MGWSGARQVGLALICLLGLWPSGAVLARGPEQDLQSVYAIRPPNIFRHNVGLLDLLVSNVGVIGNPSFVDQFGAGWRGGEYLYAGAMWIGAIASDNLAYVSTGAYQYELRPSIEPIDTIYPTYEGAPGGNRPGFSAQPDDDSDGLFDEDPLNGKDDDRDGRIDEDYAAISQQMFSCEYWDYTEESRNAYAEHRPLNVRVIQNSMAWSTEGANEFVGFEFTIINDGFELLRQVYLGFFVDSDAGPREKDNYFSDDRGAYYTTDTTFVDPSISYTCHDRISGDEQNCAVQSLHLDICYMYDVPDGEGSADGGDVTGYFGGMFLGHTTDPVGERAPSTVQVKTARFFNGSNAYPNGDPTNDAERYDLLQSGAKLRRPTGVPDDYRYCFSAGPFRELGPGERLYLQVAFVIGEGKNRMLTNAVRAQQIYNGQWKNVDDNVETGQGGEWPVGGRETCIRALESGEPVTWKDHCDSLNPTSMTVKETECVAKNYVDDDCDCCTPLYYKMSDIRNGAETLVHWVGTVAPPPPATNIGPGVQVIAPAGDRKVTVAWDNLSELSADPTQKRILFRGYKVWRVEGWNRPVGSAGPSTGDWELLANLSLIPDDSLGSESPVFLPKFRNDIDSIPPPVTTGSIFPGEEERYYYPIGRYAYVDTLGLKNGMLYFYDVTAFSAWIEPTVSATGDTIGWKSMELGSTPSATEQDGVVPVWEARADGGLDDVYVVPNPYIRGENPDGWDLVPNNADPTGTKLAFVGLPEHRRDERCDIRIYTLSGDLVQTLSHEGGTGKGAVFWNLVSRNGQDVVSGVYLFSVECAGKSKVGRFVVVR